MRLRPIDRSSGLLAADALQEVAITVHLLDPRSMRCSPESRLASRAVVTWSVRLARMRPNTRLGQIA